jgi:hypothetical protein
MIRGERMLNQRKSAKIITVKKTDIERQKKAKAAAKQ